jgi:hypothetical protein
MNNSSQAKNGFKTFVATLVISLVLFGAIYYLVTSGTGRIDIESDTLTGVGEVHNVEEEKESAFGKLARQSDSEGDVLAEIDEPEFDEFLAEMEEYDEEIILLDEDQATPSTVPVPETGVVGTTYALIISTTVMVLGVYLLIVEPRRRALLGFERKASKDQ